MNRFIALLVFLLSGTFSVLTQEPLANYKSRTIADIADLNKPVVEAATRRAKQDDETELVSADPLYSKVELQFLDAARPIAEVGKSSPRVGASR